MELELLKYIVEHQRKDILFQLTEEDFFEPIYRDCYKLLKRMVKKYGKLPNPSILRQLRKLNFDAIPSINNGDEEIFLDEASQYIAGNRISKLLMKDEGISKHDIASILPEFSGNNKKVFSLDEVKVEESKHVDSPFEDIANLHRGDLCIVLGLINSGKTMFLVNIARKYLEKGYNIIYVSFEDTPEKIKKRLIQSTFNITVEEYLENREEYDEKILKYKDKIKLVQGRNNKTSTEQLESLVDKRNKKTILIVDYLDRLRKTNGELRHSLRMLSEELKGIALENDIVVWTAKQSRRNTKGKLSLEDSGESYSTMESPDLVVSIPTKVKDKALNEFHIVKGRDQPKATIYLEVNLETQRIG